MKNKIIRQITDNSHKAFKHRHNSDSSGLGQIGVVGTDDL